MFAGAMVTVSRFIRPVYTIKTNGEFGRFRFLGTVIHLACEPVPVHSMIYAEIIVCGHFLNVLWA